MPTNSGVSEVVDKHGVTADIEAKRFDGTRTVQIQGDVTASQTWNGDSSSPLTLNASIGAKKVTTDKINDKAVQAQQIDDGAVGLTQIATNAMNGTVQDNDSKLATHASVKTYVDSQISGQGTYLGKHTVAEINAMQTADLHNGDRVMTSDSGTINLGPGGVGFDVEVGEDLILYKSGSTVQWDSMDGNFKTKQTAVDDPTASGTGLTFIDSISQDENGEITPSKKTVQDGTTSQKGVVQLEDSVSSTSTTKAATPNSVKSAYDLANTANTGLANKLDKTGDGKDVTVSFSEASTRTNIGTGEKLSMMFGKIKKWFTDLGTAAFKNVPASGDASSTEVVLGSDSRLSAGESAVQDVTVDGTSVVNLSTKVAAVPNASTSVKGAVQLAGSIGATVDSENNKAASEKAVRDALDSWTASAVKPDSLVNAYVDLSFQGVSWSDFAGTGDNSLFAKIPWDSDKYKSALIYGRITAHPDGWTTNVGTNGNIDFGLFVAYKSRDAYVVEFYPNAKHPENSDGTVLIHLALGIGISRIDKRVTAIGAGAVGSASIPTYVEADGEIKACTDDFVHDGDVAQTYSSTSEAPISGKGVAAALNSEAEVTAAALDDLDARMQSVEDAVNSDNIGDKIADSLDAQVLKVGGHDVVANIEYVAAQSGGGGDLMKTVAGTQTSVLRFMNNTEAVSIWADAKQAAANAS